MWLKVVLTLACVPLGSSAASAQSCLQWNDYVGGWDYAYCAASGVDNVAPYVLDRYGPGFGSAYEVGRWFGDGILEKTPQVYDPSPMPQYYEYSAPQLPHQFQPFIPYYPNFAPDPY